MVIDTFLFNDEFDMLDIHLAITDHYVDRWIVLEASRTFSGIPKPYNLTNNLARYQEKYPDRIQVVTLELNEDQTNLICETMMRQGLQPAIDQYSADDIVIHGDLDLKCTCIVLIKRPIVIGKAVWRLESVCL